MGSMPLHCWFTGICLMSAGLAGLASDAQLIYGTARQTSEHTWCCVFLLRETPQNGGSPSGFPKPQTKGTLKKRRTRLASPIGCVNKKNQDAADEPPEVSEVFETRRLQVQPVESAPRFEKSIPWVFSRRFGRITGRCGPGFPTFSGTGSELADAGCIRSLYWSNIMSCFHWLKSLFMFPCWV